MLLVFMLTFLTSKNMLRFNSVHYTVDFRHSNQVTDLTGGYHREGRVWGMS